MSLVKVSAHGQITIPKKLRDALDLKGGDVAEVEAHEGKLVVTPRRVIRNKAWEGLLAVMDKVHTQNSGVSEEEVVKEALKAVKELRAEYHAAAEKN